MAFALCCAACLVLTPAAQAQAFSVIHNFTNGPDGGAPYTGLTIDRAGNLYGTTASGGGGGCQNGCGIVFKLAQRGSGWVLTPLYKFQGEDGARPCSRITIGSDGTLYGTTSEGGGTQCPAGAGCYPNGNGGCGTVFNLAPPAHASGSILGNWNETVLYRFTGESDGAYPQGDIAFDADGNLDGVTTEGGNFGQDCGTQLGDGCGTVYQLTRSGSGWTENVVHSFQPMNDGAGPVGGVVLDAAGSIYATTAGSSFGDSGISCGGAAIQFTQSGGSWQSNFLHLFGQQLDGCEPRGGMIFDPSGNLYGATPWVEEGGPVGSGEVYELSDSPSNGWQYSILFEFPDDGYGGPFSTLIRDSAGNLYGTTYGYGLHRYGEVFKLVPNGASWTYVDLHDFSGGADGGYPYGSLVQDSAGNIYGTAVMGGAYNRGVIFEITP
ncbi:MAG TPA: choice-of-anchor tandem repeat GloVer-containing protein [Candidatus Bathyarchaeia archaeon]|nr:choice-of-anchor tandem repeat GloVer-containing protein [Candidatus Bathyarchaeia archaeon]